MVRPPTVSEAVGSTGHWPLATSFMDLLYSSLMDLSQFFFLSWIVLIAVACVFTFRRDSF